MSEFTAKYVKFFRETDEGENLLKEIEALIPAEYKKAENTNDPQEIYGHMKRAAGVRSVLSKINDLMVEAKKPM